MLENQSVYITRTNLGKELAKTETEKVDDSYVVVPVPDTAKALEQDPSSLLRVICRKQPSGALYAWDVTNYEGTEEEAIARAKKVTEGWKKEAEQTLQKEQAAIFRRSARKDNL